MRYRVLERARFGKASTQAVQPVKVKYHVVSDELPAVCRRYILPVNSLTQMDNMSAWVRELPAFRQLAFHVLGRMPGYFVVPYCRVQCPVIRRPVFPSTPPYMLVSLSLKYGSKFTMFLLARITISPPYCGLPSLSHQLPPVLIS